jgi:hypothetical protein
MGMIEFPFFFLDFLIVKNKKPDEMQIIIIQQARILAFGIHLIIT